MSAERSISGHPQGIETAPRDTRPIDRARQIVAGIQDRLISRRNYDNASPSSQQPTAIVEDVNRLSDGAFKELLSEWIPGINPGERQLPASVRKELDRRPQK